MVEDRVLDAAADAFGLDASLLTYTGGNVNAIYQSPAHNGHGDQILRVSKESWRSEQEIVAELHFMNYMFNNGLSIPQPFLSRTGRWVENVTEGCYASLFAKAPGRTPTEEDWNPNMFVHWGRTLGQLHLLTQSYVPLQNAKRRDWKQEPWMDMLRHLPKEEVIARQQATELLNWLETLPTDSRNYGLVHCDLHAHNIFVMEDGTITAFDFDDSCYHWFVYDIAIILYSVSVRHNRLNIEGDPNEHAAWFLEWFLKGYQEINTIESWWLEALPRFIRYRRLLDYNFLFQRYEWETVNHDLKVKWLRLKAEIEEKV
ncbi:phosphotransferase enzyme family protein [Paenibacillus sp. OV219]|uniref:phosphotransferase enzyme family protein n=1 Tax=Paenibacillus sp. OV219 TaxID=1884377 RepID=UPI0008BDC752|nr:phosphotransferase [Paenibacillus sp. OV219]SEN98633.1 Ser/Thr protein kinase RdoA involved in Cpx stress response, MazF antagonist [Paenibacillus sp. OV219]